MTQYRKPEVGLIAEEVDTMTISSSISPTDGFCQSQSRPQTSKSTCCRSFAPQTDSTSNSTTGRCCQQQTSSSSSTCCQSSQSELETTQNSEETPISKSSTCCGSTSNGSQSSNPTPTTSTTPPPPPPPTTKTPRKRFGGRSALTSSTSSDPANNSALQAPRIPRPRRTLNAIPQSLLDDPDLAAATTLLPRTYNFELPKTLHFIHTHKITRLALQLPEGLLLFACTLSDILRRFSPLLQEVIIMGDVTYGACCIDDFTARALGCEGLVHYAHSCLVPQDRLGEGVKVLYVFVGMEVDVKHLVGTVRRHLRGGGGGKGGRRKIAMVGTIQFNAGIAEARDLLLSSNPTSPSEEDTIFEVLIPQSLPLSKGEVLGCTSPILPRDVDSLIYIGDGRFHLESAMIMNPGIESYRYDPYSRRFTREEYGHEEMKSLRRDAVKTARGAKKWGLILGTLGRQGNLGTVEKIESLLRSQGTPYVVLLLSEIFPGKLKMMKEVEAWVQVSCPRLSIDWGYAFERPLLSPYEALVALGEREMWGEVYPMDFYSKEGLGRTKREVEA